jgi:hypothetical protein
MTLNYQSIIAKLYRWFYFKTEMPNNLCIYFWQLMVMWIFILPYFLLTFWNRFTPSKNDMIDKGTAIGIGVILHIIAFILISMIIGILGLFFNFSSPVLSTISFIGNILWLFTIIVFISWAAIILLQKIEKSEKRPSIILEYFKAKKNKYCPKIEWK